MKVKEGTGRTRREMLVFLVGQLILVALYFSPRIFKHGITGSLMIEILVDWTIMILSCLPAWWLHFHTWRGLSMRKRIALHIVTIFIYYILLFSLYRGYYTFIEQPYASLKQILINIGPNFSPYALIFSLLHIDLFFYEREQQQKKEKLLMELAYQSELNSLKARIQPHFLFNTLSSISASVPSEQEHTRVLIAQLADTFRYVLRSSQQESVPLYQELDFLETYLFLEKARFGSRLDFTISVSEEIRSVRIPAMLLQPLVENAVKHGIEPAVEGGRITISCQLMGRKMHFSITNTGYPYSGTVDQMLQGEGVGLSNTAKRLENQFGEKINVAVDGSGAVTVSFYIPIN